MLNFGKEDFMKFRTFFVLMVGFAICLLTIPTARADNITAYGWITTDTIAETGLASSLADPTCHQGPFRPPGGFGTCNTSQYDVKFTTGGYLGFNVGWDDPTTIASWLNSSLFPIHDLDDKVPTYEISSTVWLFLGNGDVTGTVADPEYFTINHDDSVRLVINGQVVIDDHGAGHGPGVTTGLYTNGPRENAEYSLVYFECCGGPARLVGALPVPEPGAVFLLGTVLLGLGFTGKRMVSRRSH
ncbi:MAG: PEP-CTERM sorting domain-containing protein [Candidatus Solibacter sp.]|nr:PEP-CTERM sorting domain-containing protein [Candidatus Solibacter sp.]